MHRIALTSSHGLGTAVAYVQRRFNVMGADYLNRPPLAESHGMYSGAERLAAQVTMNTDEQWKGYSDSYLARTPNYLVRTESSRVEQAPDAFDKVLELAYNVYGDAADCLMSLQNDPLHKNFHAVLDEAMAHREALAAEIDKLYPSAHPTMKTLIDAFGVRRYYFLKDWEVAVVNKRREILEKLSPEFIEEMVRGRELAESYKARLKSLGEFIQTTAALPAHIDESQFKEEELVVLRQKTTYYRRMRTYARGSSEGDLNLR